MRLLYSKDELHDAFAQAMDQYDKYYWTTFYATGDDDFDLYKRLRDNQDKIMSLIVGVSTRTFKAHSVFIKDFKGHPNAHFIKNRSSEDDPWRTPVHAKIYFFSNTDSDWCVFIGSANFTKAGLGNDASHKNIECMLFCESADDDSMGTFLHSIREYFESILSNVDGIEI